MIFPCACVATLNFRERISLCSAVGKMCFTSLLAAATVWVAMCFSNAIAAEIAIPALQIIPGVEIESQQRIIYRCAGDVRLPVRYLSTNAGDLAYLTAGGEKLLFVSVEAASGVKYVSGRYVWWVKGLDGFLEDVTQESGEPVLKACKQIEQW